MFIEERGEIMKGRYRIMVQSPNVQFELCVQRMITILRGDSGTGKTTLIDCIRSFNKQGKNSRVQIECEKKCRVLDNEDWEERLDSIKDSIVFIDEECEFMHTEAFAKKVQQSDNYFVLVSRESFPMLPYSITEIISL